MAHQLVTRKIQPVFDLYFTLNGSFNSKIALKVLDPTLPLVRYQNPRLLQNT